MAQLFPLEEFEIDENGSVGDGGSLEALKVSPEVIEKAKIIAYDSGYQAGWDDAAQAQAGDNEHIGVELAKNLQDIGFTFHEARVQVMKSLEPLLLEIVRKVLPEIVSDSIAHTVVEELLPFAETAIDAPIELVVAPQNRPAVTSVLNPDSTPTVVLIDEPTLGDGQAFLRAGLSERHIDLTASIARISGAIQSIYELNQKEVING